MALNVNTLIKGLTALPLQISGNAAAASFSNAYAAYAEQAQDSGGNARVTSAAPLFYAALAQQFSTYAGTPETAATAFCAAFTGFWTGATFSASIGTPGAPAAGLSTGGTGVMLAATSSVVTAVSTATLQHDLIALFSTFDSSTQTNLKTLAQTLHAATTSMVLVTMTGLDTTPPPTGPLPTVYVGNLI